MTVSSHKTTYRPSVFQRRPVLRMATVTGLALTLAVCTSQAKAQIPAGPGGIATESTVGIKLTQVTGLNGVIYLRVVPQFNGAGDYLGDQLEYHSSMNTTMKWQVRYDLPPGNEFVNISVRANTQGASLKPATADSWNGTTMIGKVSVKPWSMSRVLNQCRQHLTNPDGSFKASAVFNLKPDMSELVKADGFSKPSGGGSAQKHSVSAYPRTRVTVYVLAARKAGQRGPQSGLSQQEGQATGQLPPRVPGRIPTTRPTRRPQGPLDSYLVPNRRPQRESVGRPVIPGSRIPTRNPDLSRRPTRDIPVARPPQRPTTDRIPTAGRRPTTGRKPTAGRIPTTNRKPVVPQRGRVPGRR